MATKLSEMIASQPATLRTVAALDVSADADRLRSARRIFVVGTGTSHHAALLGAYLLRGGGIDAHAVSSSEFARWRPAAADGDALIVISHTGETAFAQSVRATALAADVPLVTITGPAAGWEGAIETPIKEASDTYTVSYTAALGVLGLLSHALTGTATGAETLVWTAAELEAVLTVPGISEIAVPARALALFGPGIWGVTAREGALKLRESAHVLAEGFDAELLLHGTAVPYGAGDTLIGLAPEADPDGLSAGLLAAAQTEGLTTHTFAGGVDGGDPAATFMAQIPSTVRLQLLASQLTDANGTDPDHAITGAWLAEPLWAAGTPLT